MEKLTNDQIEAKAAELSTSKGNEVTPIVFTTDKGEQIIGYFQTPEYDILMYATDCYIAKEISKAAEATLRNCLIAEESDPRITSTSRNDAKIKASFANACMKMITPYVDEYKKKHI